MPHTSTQPCTGGQQVSFFDAPEPKAGLAQFDVSTCGHAGSSLPVRSTHTRPGAAWGQLTVPLTVCARQATLAQPGLTEHGWTIHHTALAGHCAPIPRCVVLSIPASAACLPPSLAPHNRPLTFTCAARAQSFYANVRACDKLISCAPPSCQVMPTHLRRRLAPAPAPAAPAPAGPSAWPALAAPRHPPPRQAPCSQTPRRQ